MNLSTGKPLFPVHLGVIPCFCPRFSPCPIYQRVIIKEGPLRINDTPMFKSSLLFIQIKFNY
jgi:hypothetical protein